MRAFIRIVKQWTLICSLLFGTGIYILFSRVTALQPIGEVVGPRLVELMPAVIFVILYVTFVKMPLHDLRLRPWHFILQLLRSILAVLLVVAALHAPTAESKWVLEGCFVCVVCPTAAAAAVVTEKLGGSAASMTVYLLVANVFTVVLIPSLFPLLERESHLTFAMAALLVLQRVVSVLVVPLALAAVTRRWWPQAASRIREWRNVGFYLWAFNLSIVMGLTVQSLLHASVRGNTLWALCFLPLLICLFQFGVGKAVGARWNDSITAGQALGQKNTVVGIYLTLSFLHPVAAIAPCVYVIWQNLVNSLQLYFKEQKGMLRW